MIKFSCKKCGQKLNVEDTHSGKRVKCPKCGSIGVVPDNSDKIKFNCNNCGQSISVPQIHAGKKGKCPKCKNPVVIPSLKKEPSESATHRPSVPSETYEDQYEEESDFSEEGVSIDRHLILAISGIAAVVVVGLIILITVILPSGPKHIDEPAVTPQQEASNIDSQSITVGSNIQLKGISEVQPPKEDVVTKEPVQSAVDASDEVGGLDLKLQLKPKQKHNMRIIEDNNVSQKAMGQSLDIHQIKTTELEFEVETVDANNIASIKVTYLKFKEKGASQGGQMEYDSTNPEISADNPFASTYSAMIGQGFIMTVSPKGKILGITGMDEMYLKMAEKIADSEDEDIRKRLKERAQQSIDRINQRYGSRAKRVEALKEMIKKNPLFTEDKFKHIVDIVVVPFPGKSVSIGDSWQEKTILPYGERFEADGTFILKEKNQTALTIDISSKIDLNNITVPAIGSPKGQTKITMKGSYQGSLQTDQNSGWLISKKATMKITGEMNIEANQQMPQGMIIPMSIESIVTVEPIE